ncbi:hypothetical protein ACFWIR_12060, partial [Streptomyces olivaceus]
MVWFLGLGITGVVLLALSLVFDGVLEGVFDGALDGLLEGWLSRGGGWGVTGVVGGGGGRARGGAGPPQAMASGPSARYAESGAVIRERDGGCRD